MIRLLAVAVVLTACASTSGPAVTKYDGTYVGGLILDASSRPDACSPGNPNKPVTIKNGELSLLYNAANNTYLTGRVREDGSVDASGFLPSGSVALTAKVQGEMITGQAVSPNRCTYNLSARKQ